MKLYEFLSENKTAIVSSWFNEILATYPSDTSNFLKNKKDRFANPVGQTIFDGMEGLMVQILAALKNGDGLDTAKTDLLLDGIVRIRAIQEFKPSEAVGFVSGLKKVVLNHAKDAAKSASVPSESELTELGSLLDTLMLRAFDIYMGCREKIYELKANEARNLTFRLLQQANLINESRMADPCFLNFKNIDEERKEVVK